MRRARRTDANQIDVVAAYRRAGASVEVLSDVGRGVLDLLVGFRGHNMIVEVKRPGESFTPHQVRWMSLWKGHCTVVHSPQEAIDSLP